MKLTTWKLIFIALITVLVLIACQARQERISMTSPLVPPSQFVPSLVSEVAFFQIQETSGSLLLSRDGQTMAFDPQSDEIPTVYLLDITNGQITYSLQDALDMLTFSPDGQTIVTANGKRVSVWNVSTGKIIYTLKHKRDVRAASFSPDGQIIVTTDEENVYVWNAVKGRKISVIAGHLEAFSPNSQMVVTYGDGWVRVWNTTTKQVVDSVVGDWAGLSLDRRTLVIYDEDSTGTQSFQVRDSTTGQKINVFEGSRPVFSSDGQIIATYHKGKTHLWDIVSGREVGVFKGGCPVFSPNGQMLATCQSGDAYLWNMITGQQIDSFPLYLSDTGLESDPEEWIGFSPDGRILLTSNSNRMGRHLIGLRDIGTGQIIPFEGIFEAFSPTGQIFVTVAGIFGQKDVRDANLYIWDTDGQEINSIQLYDDPSRLYNIYFTVQFSPDGQWGFITSFVPAKSSEFEMADPASPGGQNIQSARPLTTIRLAVTPTLTPTLTPTVTPTRRR